MAVTTPVASPSATGPPIGSSLVVTTIGADLIKVRQVVLHEFGHALGLIHEHQNPAAAIPWNRAAVYEYYIGPPNHWTPEQVETNLFRTYAASLTQHSAFDPQSIMLYPIPEEFTEGGFSVGWNATLSAVDREYVAAWYPFG